jgi:hypothetical protein
MISKNISKKNIREKANIRRALTYRKPFNLPKSTDPSYSYTFYMFLLLFRYPYSLKNMNLSLASKEKIRIISFFLTFRYIFFHNSFSRFPVFLLFFYIIFSSLSFDFIFLSFYCFDFFQ